MDTRIIKTIGVALEPDTFNSEKPYVEPIGAVLADSYLCLPRSNLTYCIYDGI